MPIYETPLFLIPVCAVVGLCVGSFLNVLILRLRPLLEYRWRQSVVAELPELFGNDEHTPRKQELPPQGLWSPSSCPHCSARLRWWQLLPVLGFFLCRRQCRACGGAISWRYPLVEALCATAFAVCAWRFGFDLALPFALFATALLIAIAGLDLDSQWLPDEFTTPLAVAGMLAAYLTVYVTPSSALFGALLGYLVPYTVALVFRLVTGREGLGDGDVKLLGAAGFWLGGMVLTAILVGALVGLLYALIYLQVTRQNRHTAVPFGPALCVGIWCCLVFNFNLFAQVY